MVPLSGMTEPAWCDKHGVEYYGPLVLNASRKPKTIGMILETRAYGIYDL